MLHDLLTAKGKLLGLTAIVVLIGLLGEAVSAPPLGGRDVYDIVITEGRVIDPETGRDEVATVGIRGERIEAITTEELRGTRVIDAAGHIVAPGFIDILSSIAARRQAHEDKVADGVTS